MQEILGDDEPFAPASNTPAGPQPVHVARQAESYAICVDTRGKLRWTSGGHINGAFLQAGLVDEVSLLLVPGIDGRHDIAATFDGMNPPDGQAVALRLKSVEQRAKDSLWFRYEVLRS
ncbi:MAG TPA: dihydrofolate reductase family protein [Chthoniobacterales bacterium]